MLERTKGKQVLGVKTRGGLRGGVCGLGGGVLGIWGAVLWSGGSGKFLSGLKNAGGFTWNWWGKRAVGWRGSEAGVGRAGSGREWGWGAETVVSGTSGTWDSSLAAVCGTPCVPEV